MKLITLTTIVILTYACGSSEKRYSPQSRWEKIFEEVKNEYLAGDDLIAEGYRAKLQKEFLSSYLKWGCRALQEERKNANFLDPIGVKTGDSLGPKAEKCKNDKCLRKAAKSIVNSTEYMQAIALSTSIYHVCAKSSLDQGVLEHKKGNLPRAAVLYKKACDGGEMLGCFNLGNLEDKKGNLARAAVLYKKACNGGYMGGCSNLGILEMEKGNLPRAATLWKKACDGGDMLGCFNLGILEDKKGNLPRAAVLYKKACDGGHIGGCYNLGNLEGKKGNLARASVLYKKACDGGDIGGCYNLGILEDKKGNLARAAVLYKKACDGGQNEGLL